MTATVLAAAQNQWLKPTGGLSFLSFPSSYGLALFFFSGNHPLLGWDKICTKVIWGPKQRFLRDLWLVNWFMRNSWAEKWDQPHRMTGRERRWRWKMSVCVLPAVCGMWLGGVDQLLLELGPAGGITGCTRREEFDCRWQFVCFLCVTKLRLCGLSGRGESRRSVQLSLGTSWQRVWGHWRLRRVHSGRVVAGAQN